MIYIIDDNRNNLRQNQYNITYIEDGVFDGFLTSIEKLEKRDNLSDISHLEFLNNADCILLHSTTEDYVINSGFISGSTTNVIKIKELISCQGENIPLVLFSNSMGEPDFDTQGDLRYIRGIKKNIFYDRLFDFLTHYKETNQVELKILVWGKNHLSRYATQIGNEILNSIKGRPDSDFVEIHDILQNIIIYQPFIELAYPNISFNEFIFSFEDEEIQIQEFRRKINLVLDSFTKYGKNIHPWK